MVASQDMIDRVIATYRDAVTANLECQGRCGNRVYLTEELGRDVMVTADLHGDRMNFNRFCQLANLQQDQKRHLIMQEVCHGGPSYPCDEGCMSHLMLEDVAKLKTQYPDRFHFLLGNHELAEWTDFLIAKSRKVLNLLFRSGMEQLYGDQSEIVRDAALEFIASCPLAVKLDSGVHISHSLPENLAEEPFDTSVFSRSLEREDLVQAGAVFRLLWGRDFSQENADEFARLVESSVLIHGHQPCKNGFATPNDTQIILDSCGERACYVIVPLGEQQNQQQIVERIERLW